MDYRKALKEIKRDIQHRFKGNCLVNNFDFTAQHYELKVNGRDYLEEFFPTIRIKYGHVTHFAHGQIVECFLLEVQENGEITAQVKKSGAIINTDFDSLLNLDEQLNLIEYIKNKDSIYNKLERELYFI